MKHKFLVMAMCLSAALAFNGCSSDKEEDPVPEEQNENKEDNEENNQGNNEENNQDNNGENNQNNNDDETDDGKNPELVEFYSKFPMAGKSGYADYSVANDYDRIKNLIPTGNYIFTLYYLAYLILYLPRGKIVVVEGGRYHTAFWQHLTQQLTFSGVAVRAISVDVHYCHSSF